MYSYVNYIYLILDNFFNKNMSVQVNGIKQDENIIERTNKRQMVDESYEMITKAPKVEPTEDVVQRKNNAKRKNFVIMLGYLGRNYSGMQINRGTKTIEESLLSALLKANFITEEQFEDVRIIKFQRAARTDKGVSAVRQVVSLQLRKYYIIYFTVI